jgi:hypothetical protein
LTFGKPRRTAGLFGLRVKEENIAIMSRHLAAIASALLTSILNFQFSPAQTTSATLQEVELRVRLLAPLTTKLSRKGDLVSAAVVEPTGINGGILEGDVREIKGGAAQKTATIQFQFHTLHLSGKAMPVNIVVLNVANSKHELGMDEEGMQLESDKGALGTGKISSVGSALSKFHVGGGKSPGSPGVFRLLTHAPSLSLAVGSEMVVQANTKTGHE